MIPCGGFFDIEIKQNEISELEKQTNEAGFWNDNESAQKVMREISERKEWVDAWQNIHNKCSDVDELLFLAEEENALYQPEPYPHLAVLYRTGVPPAGPFLRYDSAYLLRTA